MDLKVALDPTWLPRSTNPHRRQTVHLQDIITAQQMKILTSRRLPPLSTTHSIHHQESAITQDSITRLHTTSSSELRSPDNDINGGFGHRCPASPMNASHDQSSRHDRIVSHDQRQKELDRPT